MLPGLIDFSTHFSRLWRKALVLDQKVTQTFPTDAPLKSICVLAFAALGGVPVVAGLAATARSCSGAQDGIAGRPMPVGTYITFGKFRTMHLGDITKNQEFELMCPINGRSCEGWRCLVNQRPEAIHERPRSNRARPFACNVGRGRL
jgi:hypothetical protein